MRKTFLVLLAFVLSACGGSEDLTQRHRLTVIAEAWEDHMPSITLPNQPPSCTGLMVFFTLSSDVGILPQGIDPTIVQLSRNGQTNWTEPVSGSETRLIGATSIQGIARGCKTNTFAEGDQLRVLVRVKLNNEVSDVLTTATLRYVS